MENSIIYSKIKSSKKLTLNYTKIHDERMKKCYGKKRRKKYFLSKNCSKFKKYLKTKNYLKIK